MEDIQLLELAMPAQGVSRFLKARPDFAQPSISAFNHTLAMTTDCCMLLRNFYCVTGIIAQTSTKDIVTQQYQNQIITQMQKMKRTQTRVKMTRKQRAVTQCKTHTESHILLLKCQRLISITGSDFNSFFPTSPPQKRGIL